MPPAATALLVILSGLSGLMLLGAASSWAKLGREREGSSDRPAIPVHQFRAAAGMTAAALGLLGVSMICLALVSLP